MKRCLAVPDRTRNDCRWIRALTRKGHRVNKRNLQNKIKDCGGCYDGERKLIPACTCDSSCLTCGYMIDPTGTKDCIKCANQEDTLFPLYSDGTGICGQEPPDGDDDSGDNDDGTGNVYCPDKPIKDYCDCSVDCGSSFCSCEEAKECCSS